MIEVKDLTKEYKDHKGLAGISFNVEKGEIFSLVGANGAGKSTTIKILTNQLRPTSGSAVIDGFEISGNYQQIRPLVAYLPENLMLYGYLTGIQNLEFFCGISGLHYTHEELGLYLEQAGLESKHFNKRLDNYSKGMRQKVGIAFALAKRAKILFLDEPTSGLDPKSIAEFSLLLKNLKQAGMTILMTSHDLFRTMQDADKNRDYEGRETA